MTLKFIDLFCGIGGIRLGFEQAAKEFGFDPECVFSSDIDKLARETYEMNFDEVPTGDISECPEIPDHDVLLAGFPCQPFSYAGSRRGFGDTRGTLFFEVEKIIKRQLPKLVLLENVRGLASHDKGRTLNTIVSRLESLGYGVEYRILNSADYGVPQNRMRIYIVGTLGFTPNFTLTSCTRFVDSNKAKTAQPKLFDEIQRSTVSEILEDDVDSSFHCSETFVESLQKIVGNDLSKLAGYRLIDSRNGLSIHSWDIGLKGNCTKEEKALLNALVVNRRRHIFGTHQDGKALTLDQIKTFFPSKSLHRLILSLLKKGYLRDDGGKFNLTAGNMSFEVYKFLDPESISVTVVTSDAHKLGVVHNGIVRRLTPREVSRLQGFPDTSILHPNIGASYRQLGNSVTVPVIKAVLLDILTANPKILKPTKKNSHRLVR
jgi:DNA (cytosine-5)-methyltransferase 1